ncbi:Uma2 family endonuclease [Thermomonospora umbrina]|uniref:Uma2 family endonuclease n=1 Tax=Thermomonospora umbrina TaxID=111806 RepID=UPI001B86D09C
MRDCEPYDVNTVRDHILLVVEVTSPATIDDDLGLKHVQYARAGIPVYLLVRFDKDWERIEQISEYRLDWSRLRYEPREVHRERLRLDSPVAVDVGFAELTRF